MTQKWKRILLAVSCPWLFFLLWMSIIHLCPRLHLLRGQTIAIFFLIVLPIIYFGLCLMSLVSLTRIVWGSSWGKTLRFSATIILFVLFIPYTFGPIWGDLVRTRANPAVMLAVSPEKTWFVRIAEGEKQCYKVTIKKENSPAEAATFQTQGPIFHKMRGEWINANQYQWNSSDIGTILFTWKNGSWDAEPKDLLMEDIRK